jgi:hypothetical protein
MAIEVHYPLSLDRPFNFQMLKDYSTWIVTETDQAGREDVTCSGGDSVGMLAAGPRPVPRRRARPPDGLSESAQRAWASPQRAPAAVPGGAPGQAPGCQDHLRRSLHPGDGDGGVARRLRDDVAAEVQGRTTSMAASRAATRRLRSIACTWLRSMGYYCTTPEAREMNEKSFACPVGNKY